MTDHALQVTNIKATTYTNYINQYTARDTAGKGYGNFKYVNQCIRPLGFEDVTSSMIRNYVKQGHIPKPVKKQYFADQICHVIALVLLKQVTQLENVSYLFQLQRDHEGYTDEVAYDYFCEELENILYFRFGLRDSISEIGVTDSLEKEMLRSAVTAVSHIVFLNRCFRVLSKT